MTERLGIMKVEASVGAFPVILSALFVDSLFNRIERKYQWNEQ